MCLATLSAASNGKKVYPYINQIECNFWTLNQNSLLKYFDVKTPLYYNKTDGYILPTTHRQVTWPNGTLWVKNVQKDVDEGYYYCRVQDGMGRGTEKGTHLKVVGEREYGLNEECLWDFKSQHSSYSLPLMKLIYWEFWMNQSISADPPIIEPFHFLVKKVGDRISVTCVMTSGDLPMNLVWLKDNDVISPDLGIRVQVGNVVELSKIMGIGVTIWRVWSGRGFVVVGFLLWVLCYGWIVVVGVLLWMFCCWGCVVVNV